MFVRPHALILGLLCLALPLGAQDLPIPDPPDLHDLPHAFVDKAITELEPVPPPVLPDAPSAVIEPRQQHQTTRARTDEVPGFVNNVRVQSHQTDWETAGRQSLLFLSVQHGLRLLQPKTRRGLKGPFFSDYVDSIKGIHGWGDGDGIWTNYFMHPGMGSVTSYIYIQNTPDSRSLVFDASSGAYWRSRLKAMAFAAAYSTQFEIGPYSEATIGNVGLQKGTGGYVDFVMTPIGGFGLTVLEDFLDERFVRRMENQTSSSHRQRFYRVAFNPERSIANLLRWKAPWYRDSRSMPRHQ